METNENYAFSPSLNSFFALPQKALYESAGSWPDDAMPVSDDLFNEFAISAAPEGKVRGVNKQGEPYWMDIPPLTKKEQIALADVKKQQLIDGAMQSVSVIQLKLQAGRKLSATENTRLNMVLDFIDAVELTDTSTAPDITWPDTPA